MSLKKELPLATLNSLIQSVYNTVCRTLGN